MAARKSSRRTYGKKASAKVEKVTRERRQGTLKAGTSGKTVKIKKVVAIGLTETRRAGAKVARKPASRKRAKTSRKSKRVTRRT